MAAYEYKFPGMYKIPAQTVGELCEKLQESETGLTPSSFVDASRDPESPTHSMIEWRDDVAAEAYRIEQAANIIRSIVVIQEDTDPVEKDRGFVVTPGGKSVYVSMQSALNNEEWKEHLLAQARKDMIAFKAKYRRIAELAAVIDEMDKITSRVG